MLQRPSISFFTVVTNRLHHLAITLPVNLRDNQARGSRFVVLDYGSADDVGTYLREKYGDELSRGRLQYHRVNARWFHRTRSRNMAAALSRGDIICNVDADNFTGTDFDEYILDEFSRSNNIFLSALGESGNNRDTLGRIAVRKENFDAVGGYDEAFSGYGYEDYDLVSRLERSGLTRVVIDGPRFLQAIAHDQRERIRNEWHLNNLEALYSQQVDKTRRVLLFLYKDSTLEYGLIQENQSGFRFSLAGERWQDGKWREEGGRVQLAFAQFECIMEKGDGFLKGANHNLVMETDPARIEEAVVFNTEIANRYRLQRSSSAHT